MKIATLFSGGGLVDIGAMQAGWQPVWAIEYDPSISDSYRQNIGDHILTADVCDVDYSQLPSVDWLHASPSCVNASRAKAHNGETEGDVRCAEAVVRALQAQQPQFFTLENVWTYRNFESFRMILNAVADLGYFYDFNHLNMANYGVPQNRWRLFLIASRGFLPVLYSSKPTCWLTAVQDLLPELRKSEFPKWQQRKLESNRLAEFVVNGANASSEYSFPIVAPNSPIFTITSNFGRIATRMQIDGKVLSASPRCYARWQTMPDSYILPDNKALACKIIGNGVPCEFMRRVGQSIGSVAQR